MSRHQAATQASDDPLDREIRAFERLKANLEAEHLRKWVVFSEGKLWGRSTPIRKRRSTLAESLARRWF